jgi:hypothetical protein
MKIPEGEIKPKYFQIFKKYLKKAGISIAEWHSIVIGAGTAVIGGAPEAVAVFSLVTGGKEAVKRSKRFGKVGEKLGSHFKDVKEEFGYFLATFIVVETTLPVVQSALGALI